MSVHVPAPTITIVDTVDLSPPVIIQGGMGVGVSSWQLARKVSQTGQLGVVSGTALDSVLARRLQDGDTGGHARRALAHFPAGAVAERVLKRYFLPRGRPAGTPYRQVPRLMLRSSRASQELAVVGNFAEVWLAKEGHDGLLGINFLEKVQMATPAAAYGAMLAGVDYILVGAGIPTQLPHLLDELSGHRIGRLDVKVDGATKPYTCEINPSAVIGDIAEPLKRPKFLAIVSAHVLAAYLARDDRTSPDGFVIEGSTAGGHNAPPRGRLTLDADGQPIYGPRDDADLTKIAALGLPFWLAGSFGTPDKLRAALAAGAAGVQVGTLFALAAESGLTASLRDDVLTNLAADTIRVHTDPQASPTGFPFKVVSLPGTLSEDSTYAERPRLCDMSYLRVPYVRPDGTVGYRCPAEPVDEYIRKGGALADTIGRKCLCNSLTANIGLGQNRLDGYVEQPMVTLGADLDGLRELLAHFPDGWTATEAVGWLLDAERVS